MIVWVLWFLGFCAGFGSGKSAVVVYGTVFCSCFIKAHKNIIAGS